MNSYGTIAGMKSNTIPFMILDEIDEADDELKGQGDTIGILEGRTIAVRNPKIFVMSIPSAMETSKIYKLFLRGDQRRYFVPCPLCGEYQTLELKSREMKHGLTFSREKDKKTGNLRLIPQSVRYVCRHCEKEFRESKKQEMLLAGEWRATAEAEDPRRHSYHVNGLYSPEMFLSWEEICRQFIACGFGKDLLRFKNFTINYLGNPWAHIESPKSWEKLRDRAEDYCMGEVPPGGLRLYAGIDVQGDRLEMAVWAVGKALEKWLIDYQVFFGKPEILTDSSWRALHQYVYGRKFTVRNVNVSISRAAVDCGWDPKERREKDWDSKPPVVFQFVGMRQDVFVAVRGAGELRSAIDIIKPMRIHGDHKLTRRYDLNTHVIKEIIMRFIDEREGPQALHFPREKEEAGARRYVGDELFRGFLSERYQEIKPGVMGWKKIYARNEPWDTTVYAMAAMYLDPLHSWDDAAWDRYEVTLSE